MIVPRSLAQMLAASRLIVARDAIVDELGRLLLGVTVTGHPGKLDINDVVARKVVKAPGVAVGWTSTRAAARPGGTYDAVVDWAAYVVVEDHANLTTLKSTPREAVGHAIGGTILEILGDPDVASWGLTFVDRPATDPGPQLVPMFTAKSFEGGTAYYAVTWRQALLDQGEALFDRGPVSGRIAGTGFGTGEVDFDEDDIPVEIRAMMRDAGVAP